MPIWYVNPGSRTAGKRKAAVKRRASTSPKTATKSKARRKGPVKISRAMPTGLKRYWRAHNAKFKKAKPKLKAKVKARRRKVRRNAALTYVMNPRAAARKPRRKKMARRKKSRRRAAIKAWKTRRSKFSKRRRAALKGWKKKRGGKRRRPRYSAKVGFAKSIRRKHRRRKSSKRRSSKRRAAPRRKGYSKARRRRAARKGWRTKRKRAKAVVGLFSSMRGLRKNPRRRRKSRRKSRRYGGKRRRSRGRRKSALRAFRLRRNPLSGIMATVKAAVPIVGAMVVGNVVASKVMPMIPGVDKLGRHADPVGHALMIVAGGFATSKVAFLAKHKSSILTGLGVNLVRSLIRTYAPASVQGYLSGMDGLGSFGFVQDMGALGDYVETGAEEELGDYVETSDYVETGAFEEMGGPMLAHVPARAALAPVPSVSMARTVPQWSPSQDADDRLYAGIFAGGLK